MIKYEASLVVQTVKNLPAMQEIQVWSLGQEDPLLKGMANHSSILAWRIPWTKEPGGLQSMESQRVGYDWATNTHTQSLWKVLELTILQSSKNLKEEYYYFFIIYTQNI